MLRYRERDRDGILTFVANFTLPNDSHLVRGVAAYIQHGRGRSGSAVTTSLTVSTCGDTPENSCPIEAVTNYCFDNTTDPACETSGTGPDTEYTPDPGWSFEHGDAGDVDSNGGGDDPCEYCIPEPETWEDDYCNPDFDPGCVLRYRAARSAGEELALKAIPDLLRRNSCGQLADAFETHLANDRVALWNARVLRYNEPPKGRVDPGNGDSYIWAEYNKHSGDDVNWTRTAAHEAFHVLYPKHLYPEYSEDYINEVARACAGYP